MKMKAQLKWYLVVSAATSLFAFGAYAEVCATQSHNIIFVSAPGEVDAATSSVLLACQNNQVTNNQDCSNNLSCGFAPQSVYPSGKATCETSSHGIAFQATADFLSIDTLVSGLLADCQATSVASNNDCNTNVGCSDSQQAGVIYPSGQVTCLTSSHNVKFQQTGSANSVSVVANAALVACQNNQVTSNQDCSTNLSCSDSASVPSENDVVTCHTESHNIPFVNRGPRSQVDTVSAQVLTTCENNPVSNNSECQTNLSCN
jgi:hypothetical protein